VLLGVFGGGGLINAGSLNKCRVSNRHRRVWGTCTNKRWGRSLEVLRYLHVVVRFTAEAWRSSQHSNWLVVVSWWELTLTSRFQMIHICVWSLHQCRTAGCGRLKTAPSAIILATRESLDRAGTTRPQSFEIHRCYYHSYNRTITVWDLCSAAYNTE